MRLGRRLDVGRRADLAQLVPGLDLVSHLHADLLGQIGIMCGVAVLMAQDDGRAEAVVVVDRVDRAVRRRLDRRTRCGREVYALMRAPVARGSIVGQEIRREAVDRLAVHGCDHLEITLACLTRLGRLGFAARLRGHNVRRARLGRVHLLVYAAFGSLDLLCGRFIPSAQQQIARHAHRSRAQKQHQIVPLVAQKADNAVGFLIILHISTSEHQYRQENFSLYSFFLDVFRPFFSL